MNPEQAYDLNLRRSLLPREHRLRDFCGMTRWLPRRAYRFEVPTTWRLRDQVVAGLLRDSVMLGGALG